MQIPSFEPVFIFSQLAISEYQIDFLDNLTTIFDKNTSKQVFHLLLNICNFAQ